jgi:hypothetical protein
MEPTEFPEILVVTQANRFTLKERFRILLGWETMMESHVGIKVDPQSLALEYGMLKQQTFLNRPKRKKEVNCFTGASASTRFEYFTILSCCF